MSFSKDFIWGAASAAFQVEGAYNEDGKGLGIWDAMTDNLQIKHGETGNVAADHYHRYKEDVALMKKIGLKAYRFSISWPRVMPQRGVINEKGLAFYSDLVDELLNAGIKPMVTLYHWNLPMWAHEYGGWENEQIIEDFAIYTKAVVDRLSDRVDFWMTLNEPQCFITFGYYSATAAPYLKKQKEIGAISRIVMLTHGRVVQVIRENAVLPPKVGYAPTGSGFTPLDDSEAAIEEARAKTYAPEAGPRGNSWWSDPIILGVAPAPLKDVLSEEDGKQTSVIAQLEITFADGTTTRICTDGTWRWSNDGPIRFADLKDGEIYNAAMKPSYSHVAKVVKGNVNLVASNNVPVREKERFCAVMRENHVLDFGQNIAGYLEFTVKGKPGQEIRLVCGEVLDKDGNIDLSGMQRQKKTQRWQLSRLKRLQSWRRKPQRRRSDTTGGYIYDQQGIERTGSSGGQRAER